MESADTAGHGWLDELEDIERQTRNTLHLMETLTGTAESADGLVEATVSAQGELSELILDPRVYRELDTDELADRIRAAVNDAHRRTQDELFLALAGRLPDADRTAEDDPFIGPWLAELARLQGKAPR